jgi:three-Cys-motif partner protein
LDPYGLHLDWKVVQMAGDLRTVDLFLNFPIMDMNRNALWTDPRGVNSEMAARLTRFWGDDSWKSAAYRPSRQANLFGEAATEKASNDAVVAAFRDRLTATAHFASVPPPMPMRNRHNAVVYYLFFASQYTLASKIAGSIFRRYSSRGSSRG